jgi:peptide/nickel transport system substrate-binding protein
MTRMALSTLDPADASQPQSIFRRALDRSIYDTLVTFDDFGRIQPALALSWKAEPGNRRWQFWIRQGVTFDDGSPLTPTSAATSLREVNTKWAISALADSVLIETDTPEPWLAAQLTLPKYSIVKRLTGKVLGTGPFHVLDWQPGRSLTLAANESYWGGRPFANSVEVALAKPYRDQALALQFGRTDVIEVAPDQARRFGVEGRTAIQSSPIELTALLFARDPASPDERVLREALGSSIDRASIKNVLLQGNGEPTAAILANWMSGYAFLFPSDADPAKSRQERSQVRQAPAWNISYDLNDPLSRLIVERIALNARDVGITVQPGVSNQPDIRLVTIPLSSTNGDLALMNLADTLGLPVPNITDPSPEALYEAEAALLASERIIPLFHLPADYGLSNSVKNWQLRRDGTWDLANTWLLPEKP